MTESQWLEQVQAAALRQDGAALRLLYGEARELFGDNAPELWARALSAFDAQAVTG